MPDALLKLRQTNFRAPRRLIDQLIQQHGGPPAP
jgi:hypothetical protein